MKIGFDKALSAIIDGNVTTLIAAAVLGVIGSGSVKGFAYTLALGIVLSLFTSLIVTRMLLNAFYNLGCKNPKLFGVAKERKTINFLSKKAVFFAASIAVVVAGFVIMGVNAAGGKDALNFSLEFKGGTSVTLQTEKEITEKIVLEDLKELDLKLETFTKENDTTYTMIIDATLNEEEVLKTNSYFTDKYDASVDVGVVSNKVKQDLVKNAIFSLILSVIGIVIYVSVLFTFNYAISGIVALLHDALIVVLMFSIFKLEVSTIFIAAILSILGYSINDTIVLFDRIRENKKKVYKDKIKSEKDLDDLINMSIGSTIKRNIFTSITTIIPVICLLIFGSQEIFTFNIAMFIGLLAGSYSSLFIAAFIWRFLEKRTIGKPKKKKWYEFDEKEELEIKGINS